MFLIIIPRPMTTTMVAITTLLSSVGTWLSVATLLSLFPMSSLSSLSSSLFLLLFLRRRLQFQVPLLTLGALTHIDVATLMVAILALIGALDIEQ